MTFHVSINDTQSEIVREYHDGLTFDKPYEVALKSFVTYNNVFNVTAKNNRFVWFFPKTEDPSLKPNNVNTSEQLDIVTLDQGKSRKNVRNRRSVPSPLETNSVEESDEGEDGIVYEGGPDGSKKRVNYDNDRVRKEIQPGIYEIKDIAEFIESTVPPGKVFKMGLDRKTLTVFMQGDLGIDFSSRMSIGPLLGFKRASYKSKVRHVSNCRVDIFPVNMIRIRCNLVKSNICDEKRRDDTIYEFPLSVLPGEKIIERPNTATFYSVNTDIVHELHLKVVDQDNHLVDFRGERLNIVLEFRPTS